MFSIPRNLLFATLAVVASLTLAPAQDPAPPASTDADQPFEIQEGDRVLLLGDALLERENTYGFLETRMHEQFPNRKFSVRNLSMSGDTPLGWSRASFDPPEKGFERLKEQIALVNPTVVFLGYGMAASLQEMTDRSGDITLNPDPPRYGSEPMTAARFKKELGQLMDAITKGNPNVRFVLLSPIRHEDLRKTRPGLPDPAEHNKLLESYSEAIEELAKSRGTRFVNFQDALNVIAEPLTDNGINVSEFGYKKWAASTGENLLWSDSDKTPPAPGGREPRSKESRAAIRDSIIAKNALFFHRTRPSNTTYLFGFRKHEQGQNAKEIPEFDPLIEAKDAEIDRLKSGGEPKPSVAQPDATSAIANIPPLPKPTFDTDPTLEITLWAENPLLEKPTQMNWDAQGRAWVASSGLYPMIAPTEAATDKIIVLEDTNHDGNADKSTVFADNLLLPTGVEPDGTNAAYVGQSTELLHLSDTNGDGKADQTRIVLSGFGTEDTHHIVHTLRWGPDGRLYFNQSIYIHSHLETPWGMVRLNSGGIFAYNPRTERVEVLFKGFCNPWGHAWDQWGQSFITDGAGFQGISWGIPGAQYFTYENARAICPSISPGSYPKFAGLELLQSPHFPDDWQGNAITCDFRAHRIVRFQIKDLSETGERKPETETDEAIALSGYVTKEMPDLVRTGDVSFRPIDATLGPDGALYVADWSNPVINHGEVDFRDPRRDKTHGRIWRISVKGKAPEKWDPVTKMSDPELLDLLLAKNTWKQNQSRRQLADRFANQTDRFEKSVSPWAGWEGTSQADPARQVAGMFLAKSSGHRARSAGVAGQLIRRGGDEVGGISPIGARAAAARILAPIPAEALDPEGFREGSIHDLNPRVRVEAMRALARAQTSDAATLVLDAALNQPGAAQGESIAVSASVKGGQFDQKALEGTKDPYYAYAAWLSINDLAKIWTDAIASGEWKADSPEKEKQLAWGLAAIPPELTAATLARLMANDQVPLDGTGPWIELIGTAGGPAQLDRIFQQLFKEGTPLAVQSRVLAALLQASRLRDVRPISDPENLPTLFKSPDPALASDSLRLVGAWKLRDFAPLLPQYARAESDKVRQAAIEAVRELGGPDSIALLIDLTADTQPQPVRRQAAAALAALDLQGSLPRIADVLTDENSEEDALAGWRAVLSAQGAADTLASALPRSLPKIIAIGGLRAAREIGKNGEKLVAALTPIAGLPAEAPKPQNYDSIAALVKRDGDPARGELIYRRMNLACTTCHAIGGSGGKVGPDLTSMGASAPLDYIIESLINPGAKVKEGYNAVMLTLKDGTVATGIQSRETPQEIFLRNVVGDETAVARSSIASKENAGSIMPAGLIESLESREKLDLYAFLGQLGKPGVYDASKSFVARTWWLYPQSSVETESVPKLKGGDGVPVLSLVDGRLTEDRLKASIALLPNAGEKPLIVARFQVANAGKLTLNLAGVHEAWLDGEPLAVASEPSPIVDLAAGTHVLAVRLTQSSLPPVLRAESAQVRFLTE